MPGKQHIDEWPSPSYVAWSGTMREVPDMLIAAQLSLRPLAKGDTPPTTEEARRIVGDACDLLHLALTNVLRVTREPHLDPVNELSSDRTGAKSESSPDNRQTPSAADVLFERFGHRAGQETGQPITQTNPFRSLEAFATRLTDEQLDRLNRCANGNTLRFEADHIVAPLVAGGYAREGPGRVITVTPKGRRYLQSGEARVRLARSRANSQ